VYGGGENKMIVLKEEFEQGRTPDTLIGYRVMRYDPKSNRAISGADSRFGIDLKEGGIMDYGEGHFLSNDPTYAKDYYGSHDNNVLIKAEFSPEDVLSGSLDDVQPEISVAKSRIVGWETFIDPDLQENYMTKFEREWAELMEDMTAGAGGAFGDGASIGGSYNPDGGPIGGADNYAPGDARIPKVLGAKEGKKKKKGKKGLKEGPPVDITIQRRVFPNM
jgi:hypothetical protein